MSDHEQTTSVACLILMRVVAERTARVIQMFESGAMPKINNIGSIGSILTDLAQIEYDLTPEPDDEVPDHLPPNLH